MHQEQLVQQSQYIPMSQQGMKRKAQHQRRAPAKRSRVVVPANQKTALYLSPRGRTTVKCFDAYQAQFGMTTAGQVVSLLAGNAAGNVLARGDNPYQQFQGKQLNILGIQYRISFVGASQNAVVAADIYNSQRFIILQWMSSSTPTTAANILEPTINALSPTNFDAYDNIKVLRDFFKITYVVVNNATFSNQTCAVESGYIKGKHVAPIIMDTGSATYQKNGLYICVISDSAAMPNPSVTYNMRVWFTD